MGGPVGASKTLNLAVEAMPAGSAVFNAAAQAAGNPAAEREAALITPDPSPIPGGGFICICVMPIRAVITPSTNPVAVGIAVGPQTMLAIKADLAPDIIPGFTTKGIGGGGAGGLADPENMSLTTKVFSPVAKPSAMPPIMDAGTQWGITPATGLERIAAAASGL